jgi:signal transduction histidine kinase
VGLSLQGAQSLAERDRDGAKKRIDEAMRTLDDVVRDVRSYIFALQPTSGGEGGLARTIERLLKDLEVNALVEVIHQLPESVLRELPEAAHGDVIQIVREILSNIARHAHAGAVVVASTIREGNTVVFTIEDDGIQFDPQAVARGYGLSNIEERARRLGGELAISVRRPKGMIHTLSIPSQEA